MLAPPSDKEAPPPGGAQFGVPPPAIRPRNTITSLSDRDRFNRSRITNHRDLLPDVDSRSAAARRFRDILLALASDQGGLDELSEARLQLCRRFAAASVLAEQLEAKVANGEIAVETGRGSAVEQLDKLSCTLVRIASRIGVDRRAVKDISTLSWSDIVKADRSAE